MNIPRAAIIDYPARGRLFSARSAELFKNSELPEDISVYHGKVMEREEILSNGIYADLPENERLTGIKKIFPSELLERYNTSLVQSLLLFSSELEAEIVEEDPAELRRLFKYLKFFRLLCTAEAVADKKIKNNHRSSGSKSTVRVHSGKQPQIRAPACLVFPGALPVEEMENIQCDQSKGTQSQAQTGRDFRFEMPLHKLRRLHPRGNQDVPELLQPDGNNLADY